jgi:hypothetical protein
VTNNVRDFGVRMLADMSIAVARPDSFLIDLHCGNAAGVAAAFAGLRATLRSSPPPEQLLDRLAADGQTRTATALRDAYQHGAAVL